MSETKTKIAIIGGGFSNEREISLLTAAEIAAALPSDKYDVKLVEITPEKNWVLKSGFAATDNAEPTESVSIIKQAELMLHEQLQDTDVVFIALHGKYGEDGRVQAVFDLLGIPYTGSGVLASALAMNKVKCLEILSHYDFKIPKFLAITQSMRDIAELDKLISASFGYPCIIKPNESGSSVGISLVRNSEQLAEAVGCAFGEDDIIIAQEYINGRELTCAVMGNCHDELMALPPVEIKQHEAEFFDYQTKYFTDSTEEICPAQISVELTEQIKNQAKEAHRILGCDGLTRSDFILRGNDLYFLETNTIPGQTSHSISPKAAKVHGWTFSEFIEQQIALALKNKRS